MSWMIRLGLLLTLAIVPMVGSLNATQIQNTANSSVKTGDDVAWWRWGGPRYYNPGGGYYYHGPYRHYYYW